MRKLIVAAATAATLGTIGIAATAQAQPASHGPGVTTAASLTKVAVVGIPTGFQVNAPSSASACTWTVTSSPALPKSVTTGIGGTNNCSVVIDGVFTGAAKTTARW